MSDPALGLTMLGLIVVAIMMGFPTAFTLMGMGVFFAWLAYRSVDPGSAAQRTLDLFVQGIVEIIRCVICLKQGYWPSREGDVEEVDVEKLKEELHVKDEDIEKLDAYVTRGKTQ